ncbi:MAG: RNA 2',3'-cyclic phosphodiesterase [Anaerolineae bacterium]|nr:RNA 2',3'-cyclic phosphodiesterase [Anaerolineae bacterium]
MPRLFLAIDIPEADKQKLQSLQQGLTAARWTSPDQMHITLHFLGETELAPVIEAMDSVQSPLLDLQVKGLGTFPPRKQARVLWAGIEHDNALISLYNQLGTALQPTGYAPDTRPYHPHVTLARFRVPPERNALADYTQGHSPLVCEPFRAKAVVLYESQLQPEGAVYTIRHCLLLS